MDTDNFSELMSINGEIIGLLKLQAHIQAQVNELEAEKAMIEYNKLMSMDGVDDRRDDSAKQEGTSAGSRETRESGNLS
ncbi:MAG: hypothetical protein ACR2FM_01590 [Candidatus Saccharimonadales bacterium]